MPSSFWIAASEQPGDPAIIDASGGVTTFGELAKVSNRIVHAGRSLGLEAGALVAAMLPNGVDGLAAYLAAMQAGWYFTPINTHFTAPEAAYIVSNSGAQWFLAHERFGDTVVRLRDHAALGGVHLHAVGELDGFGDLHDLLSQQSEDAPVERSAGSTMLYTSGTTGRPKGVRRALAGVPPEDVVANPMAGFGVEPTRQDIHLCCSPLYHAAPLAYSAAALHYGNRLVVVDKWDAETILRLVDREKVTWTHMVPTHFKRLLALPPETIGQHDLSSLKYVVHAGAPCPVEIKRAMIDWLGPVIYEYYGSSEGVGGTFVTPQEWIEHPGTVGRPPPGGEIHILDDDGREVGPGVVGIVYSKIRAGFEYFNDPDKTSDSRRGDLATVHDVGFVDDDGYLYLADRKSDLILSGGVNIYPAEIEAALIGHPAVRDVAVFGVPDDEWGESVHAVIELDGAVTVAPTIEDELRSFAAERLARYKVPRTIEFVSQLPRDPNGKLYKRKLRDSVAGGSGEPPTENGPEGN